MDTRRAGRFGGVLLRFCLAALPAEFRAEYGDDLRGTVERRIGDGHRRGRLRGTLVLLAECADLLASAVRLRSGSRFGAGTGRGAARAVVGGVMQDVRYGLRSLRRRPGFSLVAVVTLALGIAATTTVFSAVNGVLLTSLPFEDPDHLVRPYDLLRLGDGERRVNVTQRNFAAWRDRATRSFTSMGAARYNTFAITSGDEPIRVIGVRVTHDFLPTLGVEPILGRAIRPEEARSGAAAPVALVSYGLWQSRWGGREAVLGDVLELNGQPHTIIGVLPAGFSYPYSAEIWTPLALAPDGTEGRSTHSLNVAARLVPGVTLEASQRELAAIAAGLEAEYPDTNRGWTAVVEPVREVVLEGADRKLLAVFLGSLLVLLIAVANVGNLQLARATERQLPLAVRSALGASRWRIVRLLVVEGVLLGALAGGLGILLSAWAAPSLIALSPIPDLGPTFAQVGLDLRVLAFGTALTLVVGVVFTLPAAARAVAGREAAVLRGSRGDPGGRSRPLRSGVVVFEVALSVVLLVGAGAMASGMMTLLDAEPGIRVEGLLKAAITLSTIGYDEDVRRVNAAERIVEEIAALPGVASAALSTKNPVEDGSWGAAVWPVDREPTTDDARMVVNHRAVTPGYFEAMGTPVIRGRSFTPADDADASPVAMVSAATAERFWPGLDPIGQRLRMLDATTADSIITVVGVVGDVEDYGDVEHTWYRPFRQDPREFPPRRLVLFVRTATTPAAVAPLLREAVSRVDARVPVFDIEPLSADLAESRRPVAFLTTLLLILAGVGLVLALGGLYGVLAYAVGMRRHELGVRLALGATPGRVMRSVLTDGLVLAAVGLPFGLVGGLLLARYLRTVLADVQAADPVVLGAVGAAVVAVASLAAYLPARRAGRTNPVDAFRA